MNQTNTERSNIMRESSSILDLSGEEACEYLMRGDIYCNVKLPPYFNFDVLLSSVAESVGDRAPCDLISCTKIGKLDDVNYSLLDNKDGKYAWRRFDLIHPLLYVLLVNCITEDRSWEEIRCQFKKFKEQDDRIRCLSLPIRSRGTENPAAGQVTHWWKEVELKSIEYALSYEYLIHTDVVDCYPSIYTHSIPWALHGKGTSKEKKRNKNLIGNQIDALIRNMRHGQTNGIPQGSVLMDLIAEMVLGYADKKLASKLKEIDLKEKDYRILRYRDDYRIFTNSTLEGEEILRSLADVMMGLGMRLHPQKTEASDQLIWSSIERDKRSWMPRKQQNKDLLKYLLIIHDHSTSHPNSGSLVRALDEFGTRLIGLDKSGEFEKYDRGLPLISIAVDIAYRNPRTWPQVALIVSMCLKYLEPVEEKKRVLQNIKKKFSRVANAGLMELWIQRICLSLDFEVDEFDECLCKLVSQKLGSNGGETTTDLWNNSWVKDPKVGKKVIALKIVDKNKIDELPRVIEREEVALFHSTDYLWG